MFDIGLRKDEALAYETKNMWSQINFETKYNNPRWRSGSLLKPKGFKRNILKISL